MPQNFGELVIGQSKKLITKERISGPAVNTRSPAIHGRINK